MIEVQLIMYQILLFYKYVSIENPHEVAEAQRALQTRLSLKGRSIIAHEGLNITLEGTVENTEAYIREVEKDPRFQNIHWKKSEGTGRAFAKVSVKVKPEIVSLRLSDTDIDPNKVTGKKLSPDELHDWIKNKKEFYIIDMRNMYEHTVGKFEGSICPPMRNFRDLPKLMKTISHLKDKTVLTVCTGGIRCEKASGYLISQGFTNVYQLDGGIVSYMEKYPNEDFKGKLYVFDHRKVMGFYTDNPQHEVIGSCAVCGEKCENFTNCGDVECHAHFVCCKKCLSDAGGEVSCPSGCHYDRSGHTIHKGWFLKISSLFKQ
ncbi:MAG: rhodanese-related sulfurtransferase [Candidatus Pacebacteria bacterium]|nr:rhodanese-related sulfurtransferase [Candidatus Paceibacterota bacterium]